MAVVRLRASLKQIQQLIKQKQEQWDELEVRRAKEAKTVESGKRQVEHIKAVLSRASAHRDLKISLLKERQELIQSLQHEISEVVPSGPIFSLFFRFASLCGTLRLSVS